MHRPSRCALVVIAIVAVAHPIASAQDDVIEPTPSGHRLEADIEQIVENTSTGPGICALIGRGWSQEDAEVAIALVVEGGFRVHVWESSAEAVEQTRTRFRRHLDWPMPPGPAVIVERGDPRRLPWAESTIDLLVANGLDAARLDALTLAEVTRVLCPHGSAYIGGVGVPGTVLERWLRREDLADVKIRRLDDPAALVVTKPRPEGEGDWSHLEHGPDNNPVSRDQLIKAPYMTKWLGEPYYIAMPAVTVAANGRIYLATGHIAHHKREEPWLNTLMGRNGYNGTILWQRKLPDGYLVHRSAFVAQADTLYMIDTDGSGCLLVDGRTGEDRGRIDRAATRGQWKWMAIADGILYALIGSEKDPPETTIVRSDRTHWSWGELSKGYYAGRVPWGFGERILAWDLEKGEVLWEHRAQEPIDSRGMALGGGRIFHYCPDSHVASLDAKTGKPVWKNSDAKVRELIEEVGRGLGSTPGFRTMTFCLFTPDVLVYQGQTRMNVVALSTKDGYLLWNRKKTTNNPNAVFLDEGLVLGIGPHGSSLLVELRTGKTLGDLGFAKRSCARLTATTDSLFCRGMPEGLTRFDRSTRKVSFNGAVRPSCNDGVIAANGLLYMGPWLCDCNLTLMGRVVMTSAGSFDFDRAPSELEAAARIERASSGTAVAKPLLTTSADWETYRGDASRGAFAPVELSADAVRLWRYDSRDAWLSSDPYRATAATTAGDLVWICGDDGVVRALDAATGALTWIFTTAGPIFQPPTIDGGRAFVGSGDGWVYCLEAATGRLLWRYRAAPVERRIPVYGALSSTWPVHSGVLVKDGVAYAAAGIIDYDGTHVVALDAATGDVRWENRKTGHLDASLRKGVSAQGFLTAAHGRLWMPGGNVVSPASYDLASGKYLGPRPHDGSPRANRGEEIGVAISCSGGGCGTRRAVAWWIRGTSRRSASKTTGGCPRPLRSVAARCRRRGAIDTSCCCRARPTFPSGTTRAAWRQEAPTRRRAVAARCASSVGAMLFSGSRRWRSHLRRTPSSRQPRFAIRAISSPAGC